jgi:hypothetical protein
MFVNTHRLAKAIKAFICKISSKYPPSQHFQAFSSIFKHFQAFSSIFKHFQAFSSIVKHGEAL